MSGEFSGPIIRASELGQYAFCARSWWLERVQGMPSANVREMSAGVEAHLRHGRSVVRSIRLQWFAYGLLLLSLLLAMVALLTRVWSG